MAKLVDVIIDLKNDNALVKGHLDTLLLKENRLYNVTGCVVTNIADNSCLDHRSRKKMPK